MSQLFLRFHDETFASFDWAVADVGVENTRINWQQSYIADLPQLITKNPQPVILFVPQQTLYFTEFEVPENASRQVLASIEYQIEDQLAQDTETQHFAVGRQSGSRVPIFVVAQSVMLAIQSLQQTYRLKIQLVLPEMYLCPAPSQEGEVTLISSQAALVLRYGDNHSIKCLPEVLPSIMDLIGRQMSITHIDCYVDENNIPDSLRNDKYSVNTKPFGVSEFNFDRAVNLQQRQFQASSHWLKLLHAWKGITAAAIVLLSVFIGNRVAVLEDIEQQLSSIKNNQYELIKGHVEPGVTRDSNLKKEMIKLLQNSSSSDQQTDFLHLLLEFSQARESFSSIEIVKIGYQLERLSIDISSKQLNDVESLHAALRARGLAVDLDRLNIKPELVSGQFVVKGANSG